jgi:hypothetical protein
MLGGAAGMTNTVKWQSAEVKPRHQQEVLMLCENGAVCTGFYVAPEESDSMLTGFCKWSGRGPYAAGVGFVWQWTALEDLLPKDNEPKEAA